MTQNDRPTIAAQIARHRLEKKLSNMDGASRRLRYKLGTERSVGRSARASFESRGKEPGRWPKFDPRPPDRRSTIALRICRRCATIASPEKLRRLQTACPFASTIRRFFSADSFFTSSAGKRWSATGMVSPRQGQVARGSGRQCPDARQKRRIPPRAHVAGPDCGRSRSAPKTAARLARPAPNRMRAPSTGRAP